MRLFLTCCCIVLAASGVAMAAGPSRKAKASCGADGTVELLRGVTPEGDLDLGSGRLARLAGIRLPDQGPIRAQALAWLRLQTGRAYTIFLDASEPDRWGRVPARLVPEGTPADGPDRVDLAQGLVGLGLSLVDPSGSTPFCRPDLFAVETAARRQGLGLWADDGYKAISAAKADRLRDRVGHFVLVEGRIRSVGERKQRTYLNFGTDWASDFTVLIPSRVWSVLQGRGFTGPSLTGRMVRVRGIVEDWQGPAITVTLPEMLERMDNGPQNRQTTRTSE